MLWSSQSSGDALGRRGLELLEPALHARRDNVLYITDRAYALLALGQLDDARRTAEFGLRFEPRYPYLVRTLGEVALQKGELQAAEQIIQADHTLPTDDIEAILAFAKGDDDRVVDVTQRLIGSTSPTYETFFTMLLKVAALTDNGHIAQAKQALADFQRLSPEPLHHLSFIRQDFFALPDPAWQRFKHALATTGLAL